MWSPLRASSYHCFVVGALRAQGPYRLPHQLLLNPSFRENCDSLQKMAWTYWKSSETEPSFAILAMNGFACF